MDSLQLSTNQINNMLDFVKQAFPGWKGFTDSRFEEEEVTYKQKAIQKAKVLLNETELRDLIVRGEFDTFIDRLVKTAQAGRNLLYLATPKKGDLSVLFHEGLDKQAFCLAFMDLIYGNDPSVERLAQYIEFLQSNKLPNKWTFPTYYLFVCHPDSEMFVKPMTTQWFLQFAGMQESLPSIPSAEIYRQVLHLCQQLWEALQAYQPRDYVDIQGFIWAAYSSCQPKKKLAKPFNKLFKNWGEAQWAFDILETAFSILSIQKPNDSLISVTCGAQKLRFSYGNFLVFGFSSKAGALISAYVALIKDKINLPWLYVGDFIQPASEQQITLYELSIEEFRKNQSEIMDLFEETLNLCAERFEDWKASPYHIHNNEELAAAIIQPEEREKVLSTGLQTEPVADNAPIGGLVHYWKIAPGENAWNWDACKNGGYITIGWEETGDVSKMSREEFDARCKDLLAQHPDWGSKGVEQVWDFAHLQIGDRIVANRGTKEVIGIGTVSGSYTFVPEVTHGHHVAVHWDDTQVRPIKKGHWVRTMLELNQKEFEEILHTQPIAPVASPNQFFDEQTFELLEQLHHNPTQAFYNEHKQEFKAKVEQPFQQLMQETVDLLRPEILDLMETEKNLFSRFNKNDFGKMGAWDFYWGAFYPKGGKRTNDPQLSLWMNYERLEIGFYIGNYGEAARSRFRKNCQENAEKLIQWLSDLVNDRSLVIGGHSNIVINDNGTIVANNQVSWEGWLRDPEKSGYDVSVIVPKDQLLRVNSEQLVELVASTYIRFFPLIFLATSDVPMAAISEYLGIVEKPETQPEYPLSVCADQTGVDIAELQKWVKAVDRKKQVVLYGPPGTGKTFIAEKLAQNLIGGTDGFYKLIQFHPEVSYEDFIQGIRPKPLPNGGLNYPIVPGRFMEFCEKANSRKGTCVLIIDEINRANLARVFGELMYLLEYRDKDVELSAGNRFKIPENVRIIGTMNTADRSIALVDHALRRRFAFLPLYPNYTILKKYHERKNTGFKVDGLISVLEDLNKQIADRHYTVGTSYFLRKDIRDQIVDIWQMEIEPYLEEFFFDQPEKYQRFCWDKVAGKIIG